MDESSTSAHADSAAPTDFSDRALARLALAATAAEAVRRAAALFDPRDDAPAAPRASLLARSVALLDAAQRTHAAAVVHERARGTTWTDIASILGIARQTATERYASFVEAWDTRLAQDRSPAALDARQLGPDRRSARDLPDFDAVAALIDAELRRLEPDRERAPIAFDEERLARLLDAAATLRGFTEDLSADRTPEESAEARALADADRAYAAQLRAYAEHRAAQEAARPVVLLPEDEDLAALLRLVDEPLISGLRLDPPGQAEEFGQWDLPDTFAMDRAYRAFGRVWAALPEPVRQPREGTESWLAAPDGARTLVPVHAVRIDPDDLAVLWQALDDLRSALAGTRTDQLGELLAQVVDMDAEARQIGPAGLVDALARLLAVLTHTPDPGLTTALRTRADGAPLVLDPAQYAAYRRHAETWTLLLRSGPEGLFKY